MLTNDAELQSKDVQNLANRDAVALFFATLGYNTNERIAQTRSALGLTPESLAAQVTYVERIAQQDGGLQEVYLFELKSITTATIEALARFFRNRNADYLLVLTTDYEQIDFVLLQRYVEDSSPTAGTPGPGLIGQTPKLRVRPRVLTVERRKPNARALRVLRRFSYTEADPFAQWDKLLSAYDVADWSEPYFNNRALFSDYYLNKRLPESPEWNDKTNSAAMVNAFKSLRARYADAREEFTNAPEATVRTALLEPVLRDALGFTLQPGKPSTSAMVEPDYRLYAPGSTGERPLAVCLAYCWARNLDGRDDLRDSASADEDPGQVAVALLARDEADWAIVTNGKTWRLYAGQAHSRATNYYEIDLEETLAWPETERETAFRYFWLLFRAAAFLPAARAVGAETQTGSFLSYLLAESDRYARELEEELKERVFGEIFPHFARGFITAARAAGRLPADLEDRPADERQRLLTPFFSGTLTFLYRLLFLLYAESRSLLPVREEHGYYLQSLEKLKREIAAQGGPIEDEAPAKLAGVYTAQSTILYDRLLALFAIVDRGNQDLNVPVYNGGLFMTTPDPADSSPEADVARFLANHKIPDRYLVLGLDRMSRDVDPKSHALGFIDYKSLGVRQLGSIYEGLLEFALHVAPVPMAVVKGKRTEEIVPLVEAQQQRLPILKEGRGKTASDRVLPRGTIYLENNRRERKATGSYYTPDYIVKYIVQHTVGPVLDAKLEALRPAFRLAQQTLAAERTKAAALKDRRADSPENQAYLKHRADVVEAFFDLRVLDPAMGSGHFLVEAVDYITDRLAAFLSAFPWNPVRHGLGEIRREITAEMEHQGVSIDAGRLTDLNLLKRQVLKRCIYGVDLNPMAVELAKVSLWLDCFTLGAPLSFLDHHMKVGNSLIGSTVHEVQDAFRQELFGNQFAGLLSATTLMQQVGALSDATAAQVAVSRRTYGAAAEALAPFKRLLDLWTSQYFGNKGADWTMRLYANAIVAGNYSKTEPVHKAVIDRALTLASTKRYFHWELEFPEVFYDQTERKVSGGFDVVVGNPPYVRAELADKDQRNYIMQSPRYKAVWGRFDVYLIFMEQGISLLKKHGYFSFIVPSAFLTINYAEKLRYWILQEKTITSIVDARGEDVFPGVGVSPCVIVIKDDSPTQAHKLSIESLPEFYKGAFQRSMPQVSFLGLSGSALQLDVWADDNILKPRIDSISIPLAKYCYFTTGLVGHNSLTGASVDRLIHSTQVNPSCKPYIEAKEWEGRYSSIEPRRYIEYNPAEMHRAKFPELFESEKILIQRIAAGSHITATLDKSGVYVNHVINCCVKAESIIQLGSNRLNYDIASFDLPNQYELAFFLALMTSRLLGYYHNKFLSPGLDIFPETLRQLPIRRINFTTSQMLRAVLVREGHVLYTTYLDGATVNPLLTFLDTRLQTDLEEADVVHDLLAFLAEEMIRLNKEKRTAQDIFLNWLATVLQIPPDKEGKTALDVLTGKTQLEDFPGDYQKGEAPLDVEKLLEILQKNKARLGVALSTAGLLARIRTEYAAALAQILPLKERLARTDQLIDQIVYRLYGLTDEEIAVVEGHSV